MNYWEQDKEIYLSFLKTGNGTIEDILKLDDESNIMTVAERKLIKDSYEKNRISINKIEKDIFEVAVVGLEKSGKSTFANALISNKILPDAPIRCTYTSTQLEFGEEDKAVVEFYSFNEFNIKFMNLLESIGFKTDELKSFDQVDIESFEKYFNDLKIINPTLYQLHAARTEEDIKEILNGKNDIIQYLGMPSKEFHNFEVYGEELKSFITNPRKSRAAKKIIIRSSELRDMKNIVIYDVPGFDSPTQIHEKQTIERLKHADAIVLITNVGQTPNLLGTQLNVLLKENDDDGIILSEKLFIFGNKIDLANDRSAAETNIEALYNDSTNKYKLVNKKRLFIGSSLAYLQELQLEKGQFATERLSEFGLSNKINDFKFALQEYYNNERFEVLKQRINTNINEMKTVFLSIYEKNNIESNVTELESRKFLITTRFMNYAIKNLQENLSYLRDEIKQDILQKEYFTNKIKELLNCSFQKITDEDIEKVRILVSQAPGAEFPTDKINNLLRENLYSNFMSQFTNIVIEVTSEKVTEINGQILDTLLKTFDVEKNNQYYNEIVENIRVMVEQTTSEVSYDRKSFMHLIERFSRDLFDILIFYPFATPSRFEKFEQSEQDFYSLAMYYSNRNINKPFYMQPLIDIIIAHGCISNIYIEEIENKITTFLLANTTFAQYESKTRGTVNTYSKRLYEEGVDVDLFIKSLNEGLHKMERVLGESTSEMVTIDLLNKVIQSVLGNMTNNGRYPTREYHLDLLKKRLRPSQTREELLNEVNTDIDYLNTLLTEVVTRAISLEKPFLSTLTKQINKLIEIKNGEDLSDFVAANITKIKYKELIEYDNKITEVKTRKLVVEKIETLVDRLETIAKEISNSDAKELVFA